jgi:shikimate kinase
MKPRNIYIVGFMGTGKSTIGKELAQEMGRKFLDMDVVLEKRFGKSINEIFNEKGEDFFREEEKKLAFELADTYNQVIATGGGTITIEGVKELFSRTGILICLFADKSNLISRLQRTDKRPMLKGDSLETRIDALMDERREIYEKIPFRVNTTNLSPKEAAKKIVNLFGLRQRALDQLQNQYIIIGESSEYNEEK